MKRQRQQRFAFEEINGFAGIGEIEVDSFAGGGGASLGISQATGRSPTIAINHNEAAIRCHAANHPETQHLTEDVWAVNPHKVTNGRPVGLLWLSPDCKHHSRAKGGKPVEKGIRGLAWMAVRWAVECKPRVIVLENVCEFEFWGPLVPQWRCQSCDWKGTEGQAKLARRSRRCPRCDSAKLKQMIRNGSLPSWDEWIAKTRSHGGTRKEYQRLVRDTQSGPVLVPDPARKGVTFKRFVGRLRNLGYAVEWRTLNAADWGAPTHRRRLFLIARWDGTPIVWPEPTHGDPKREDVGQGLYDLRPWRTAAECIDWSLPCPSIFMTDAEAKAWAKENGCAAPKRPLAEKTLRRIALGIKRYVLDNPKPFIVVNTSGNPPTGVDEPMKTVTTGNHHYVCTPVVARYNGAKSDGDSRTQDPGEPLTTIDTSNRFGIVAPVMVRTDMHKSNATCAYDPQDALRTITSSGGHAVCAPILVPVTHNGERRANHLGEPLATVTGAHRGELALVAPTLIQTGYGERDGQQPRALDLQAPLGTIVAGGQKHGLVAAFIAKHFGGVVGHELGRPVGTITARDHHSIVAANLIHLNRHTGPSGLDDPSRTITAGGNHAALVYSFLVKYFGTAIGTAVDGPMPTATGKDRFGLVTVTINGDTYVIVDIGMRMLSPRELARGQGFPDDYKLPGEQIKGTKSAAVSMIGNSVSPCVARAVVAANYSPAQELAVA